MSTNWKPGMKAVCIRMSGWTKDPGVTARIPEYGEVFLVVEVYQGRGGLCLVFEGTPNGEGFLHISFKPATELDLQVTRIEKEGSPVEVETVEA